jgi:DNA polymerase III sliding clamp (beta) subunit (PCNA family)
MKYIELATSKDATRSNINHVYRHKDGYLIATDGHRLHYSNGLEKLATGHYVDGQDHGQFPDIAMVLERIKPTRTASIIFTQDDLKKIKGLAKLIEAYAGKELPIFFEVSPTEVTFSFESKSQNASAKISLAKVTANLDESFKIGLNLKYLIDAIELPIKESPKYMGCPFEIKFTNDMSALVFSSKLGNALVMPLRPDYINR